MSEEPTCKVCGFSYVLGLPEDEERHARFHDEEENGPSSDIDYGIHTISLEDSESLQFTAEQVFRVGNRETNYDFPLFTVGESSTNQPVAAIQILNGRAIAGVLTRLRPCDRRAQLASFILSWDGRWRPSQSEAIAPQQRRSIEFIWVHRRHRGKETLNHSLTELERHFGIPTSELSHTLPFTEAALKFWSKKMLGTMYIARPT
jgi:hypothetical protein